MYLNCQIPTQEELLDLDSMDLAFLTMTGHVEWIDLFDMAFTVMKASGSHASGQYLWGPEADLLTRAIVSAWKKVGAVHCKRLQAPFNLSGDISVNMKVLRKALKKSKKAGEEMWKVCGNKVRTVMEVTVARSKKHFEKQRKTALKLDTSGWEAYMAAANADHVKLYVEKYPERILHPEVQRLAKLAQQKPDFRLIDKAQLSDRITKIHEKGNNYFANMSDVQVGRTWTFTGLQMAKERGVTEYMIVAEQDAKTCPVCRRLDGKHFPVAYAHGKMVKQLEAVKPGAKEALNV